MHKSIKSIFAVLILAFAITSVAAIATSTNTSLAKSDKSVEKSKSTKEGKINVKQEAKKFVKAERKSEAGPEESMKPGNSNAKLHKEKVSAIGEILEEIANKEKNEKKGQVAKEIEEVIEESEETSEEAAQAIMAIESKNKFKQMLMGTDYKNLGQLRSNLVRNENQIRKLTRALEGVDIEDRASIEEQLLVLTQERERIKTIITDNEEGFSILGWAFRLINGYPKESIDEEAEEELMDDVQEALDEDEAEEEEMETEA